MANEIIGKKESYILVRTNADGVEQAMYQDMWNGGFSPTEVNNAKRFTDLENAQKIAETLNMLYQLTGQKLTVKVAFETIDREFVDVPKTQ